MCRGSRLELIDDLRQIDARALLCPFAHRSAQGRLDFCVHCCVKRQCCSVAHPVALEMPDECTDHTSTNQHAAVSRDDMDVSVRVGEETRKTFEEDTR